MTTVKNTRDDPSVVFSAHNACPKCGNTEDHYMTNYSMMWHEGDIHCGKCGAYIRMFDAG